MGQNSINFVLKMPVKLLVQSTIFTFQAFHQITEEHSSNNSGVTRSQIHKRRTKIPHQNSPSKTKD
jgi:hypothetical protein